MVVYYVIWFMDDTSPESWPVLSVHRALGLLMGTMMLPRLVWRLLEVPPDEEPGSRMEHALGQVAHWGLYMLMIVLPVTGYAGTDAPTDFGLFAIPSFRETALFGALSTATGLDWEAFEPPVDAIHHFVGKWIAWAVVLLHILAALFHHLARLTRPFHES